LLCDGLRAFACVVVFTLVYTIKVETIENNSHLKWTTLTPHRWPHTTGPKMVDRRKQLFLKCFHSKPPTFLTIALLCTHLLISYGKPISYYEQLISYGKPISYYEQLAYAASCFQISMHGDLMFPNLHMESTDLRVISDCIGSSSPSSAPSGSRPLRRVASGRSSRSVSGSPSQEQPAALALDQTRRTAAEVHLHHTLAFTLSTSWCLVVLPWL